MIHIKQQFKVSVSVCDWPHRCSWRLRTCKKATVEKRRERSAVKETETRSWRRFCCFGPTVQLRQHLHRRRRQERCCCTHRVAGTQTAWRHFLQKQRDLSFNKTVKIVCTEKKKVNTNKMLWTYCWVAHHSETGSPSSFGSIPCIHPLLALLGLFGQVCCDGIQKKVYLLHRYLYSSLRVNVRCNKTVTRATEILQF